MYSEFFGFKEKPFTIAPNPRYLFMSERHREALAHLLYGMQGEGGVVVLTGEVGTGKTTICRSMLGQVPEKTDIAYIINPKLSATELLATVCDELQITRARKGSTIKALTDLINDYLLASHAEGRNTVLIIDEAQNLDPVVLEQLRLLTNLETDEKKLLQIILIGQPELSDKLAQRDLRQLAQRITARSHLTPLTRREVGAYIEHRLEVAGNASRSIFQPPVIRQLFQASGGIPRMINLIADRALLGAYAKGVKSVSRSMLRQAVQEVKGETGQAVSGNWFRPAAFVTAAVAAISLTVLLPRISGTDNQQPATQAETTVSALTTVAPPEPAEATAMVSSPAESDAYSMQEAPLAETTADSVPQPESSEPVDIPAYADQNNAFKPLFAAWNIQYDPETDGDACAFAQAHDLLCLRQQGDIASMRNLDRPAVLTIAASDGTTAFTPIISLAGTSATAAINDGKTEIPLNQLALQSHNDFTILWKAPAGYDGPTRPGYKGDIVSQLAERCSAAMNLQWIGSPRTVYDKSLKEQVRSFQRERGLNPDGVAGPITWIHINSLTQSGIPTLRQPAAGKETVNG